MYTTLGFQPPATFFARSSRTEGYLQRMQSFGNLTFFKNYAYPNSSTVDADFSRGSRTGTWTVTRSSTTPATYIDSTGLIATKTDTTPRFTYGFYTTTGITYNAGIFVEGASTNLVPKASVINDATWTASNITPNDSDAGSSSPDGTATTSSLTATAGNGTLLLASAVTAQTYSVWLKRKTGTGNIDITANGGTAWTTVTVTSSWTRHQVTASSASQVCGIRIVTSGDAVYVWGNQFEALPFASTLIPTTGSALTRNAETLTYVITGNRTADTETFYCSITTLWNGADATLNYRMFDTDTVDRNSFIDTTTDSFNFKPSGATPTLGFTSDPVRYTKAVYSASTTTANVDPNTVVYVNGTSESQDNTNISAPAWGTNFYVGCSDTANRQLYGVVHCFACYSVAQEGTVVSSISQMILNS